MGHLNRLQKTYEEVTVIGVTDAPVATTKEFAREHAVRYALLAEAEADRKAFGVDMIWGNQLYLLDPEGRVVADSPAAVDAFLLERFMR
ncbi:MAG: TlpA family protein disulfide reductase [Planctomycetota bacterium]